MRQLGSQVGKGARTGLFPSFPCLHSDQSTVRRNAHIQKTPTCILRSGVFRSEGNYELGETERQGAQGLRAGDIVVVTGGAQGIGRAIARRAANAGARVAVLDVLEGGEQTARLLNGGAGAGVFVKTDVRNELEVVAAARQIRDYWGVPFALVNNAGVFPRERLLDMSLDDWNLALRVNLTGTFLCAKAFGRMMLRENRGAIINISSGHGLQGAIRAGAYCASKAGIISVTQTLALELAPDIRVNCVLPGVTETAQPLAATTLDELRGRGGDDSPRADR